MHANLPCSSVYNVFFLKHFNDQLKKEGVFFPSFQIFYYDIAFSPTTPITMRPTLIMRPILLDSPKKIIFTNTAPAVPIPIHTEYADRKSTRLNSSHVSISYAVFCL